MIKPKCDKCGEELQWRYAGPLRNWPAGSWAREIEKFFDRYDEGGVKRTIKIDECDRKRVSRELAEHLKRV